MGCPYTHLPYEKKIQNNFNAEYLKSTRQTPPEDAGWASVTKSVSWHLIRDSTIQHSDRFVYHRTREKASPPPLHRCIIPSRLIYLSFSTIAARVPRVQREASTPNTKRLSCVSESRATVQQSKGRYHRQSQEQKQALCLLEASPTNSKP